MLVRITVAGRQMLDDVEILREGIIRRVLDELDEAQLAAVAAAMADLRIAVAHGPRRRLRPAPRPRNPGEELASSWKRSQRDDEDYVPTLEEDPALGLSHREKMEILFAVMLGLFLGALDQTIVGPALPTIVTQLTGNDYYVWAVTIYLLTSTISVPFWGKLSDLYGRKPIFMIGIVIFLDRLGAVRPEPEHGDAHPVPRHPGHRRRVAVPRRARDHR